MRLLNLQLLLTASPEPREKRYRLVNNAIIDFERTRTVSAAVRCTDRGEPPRSSLNVTTFQVLNLNEHAPVFPLCSAAALSPPLPPSESESDPTTQSDGILSGVDVLCCSSSSASAGVLEVGAECVLDVNFMEGEGSQGYRPQGSSSSYALGKRVHLRATDADADSKLRYWLAPDNPRAAMYLSLNSETGELRLREPLDRETLPQFDVKVFATDCPLTLRGPHANTAAHQASGELCNRSVSALLRVRVADANDNVPQVLEPTTFVIPENAPPHTCFAQRVLTRDDDQSGSPNADVALSFAPSSSAPASHSHSPATSDPSRMFTLSSDGELCASQSLDRERQHTHYLTVYAADRGTPAQTATATLTVHVTGEMAGTI